jgi:hypothetical protein
MAVQNTKLTDFYDEIAIQVPGATIPIITQTLRATLREFFVDSGAWVVEAQPMKMRPGKADYYLDPQAEGDVLYVMAMSVDVNNYRAKFLVPEQMQRFGYATNNPSPVPVRFRGYVDTPGKFTIAPYPAAGVDTDGVLQPYVALTLPENRETVPSWMIRYWKDIWIEGCLSKLMIMPDKPYSNLTSAKYYQRRFRNGISTARDTARRQWTSAENSFAFPRWA